MPAHRAFVGPVLRRTSPKAFLLVCAHYTTLFPWEPASPWVAGADPDFKEYRLTRAGMSQFDGADCLPASDRRHPFAEGHCATSLPLVSVIVRSLDRETLAQALDSLAAQTHPLIEILLVNAKGSDHRPAPDLWGERPVRFIDSSQPVPRAAAANRGLDAARSDWLLFLDDDDFRDRPRTDLSQPDQTRQYYQTPNRFLLYGRRDVPWTWKIQDFPRALFKHRLTRNEPELTDEWRIAGLEVG